MIKKYKITPNIPVVFLVFLFLIIPVIVCAKPIDIPSRLGTVQEIYEASSTMPNSGRTIINIQDAHCNYEAQKNMSGLLDYLVKEYGLKLIMVEGGSGDVGLSSLRGYADKKAREEVADKYLREGKISGEEYLDIISDRPLELYGIEDQELYEAHLDSFNKVDSVRAQGLKELSELSRVVDSLKPHIYGPELLKLEEYKKGYEAKAVTLAEYCRYLCGIAGKKGLNLYNYPQLAAFSETARLEKGIDPQKVESQRNALIKELAKVLDKTGARNLILMTQGFKANMVTPEKYYAFLESAGGNKVNIKRKYPQLYDYIKYITVSKEVNAPELIKEMGAVEEGIRNAALSADKKELSGIDRSLRILTKMLNLELTPEDYAYFTANKSKFSTASWADFLFKESVKYNLNFMPAACKSVDGNLAVLDEFYRLGASREKAFIKNITDKMNASGERVAVLIAGGFHTPGITRMLKAKEYSYIIAAPIITQKGDSDIYLSVLRNSKLNIPDGAGGVTDSD
ncbi:MAG: hypothetical protein WC301_04875 [Candidatus Omnitrophota bacterium]|jgi:hypothetical protein